MDVSKLLGDMGRGALLAATLGAVTAGVVSVVTQHKSGAAHEDHGATPAELRLRATLQRHPNIGTALRELTLALGVTPSTTEALQALLPQVQDCILVAEEEEHGGDVSGGSDMAVNVWPRVNAVCEKLGALYAAAGVPTTATASGWQRPADEHLHEMHKQVVLGLNELATDRLQRQEEMLHDHIFEVATAPVYAAAGDEAEEHPLFSPTQWEEQHLRRLAGFDGVQDTGGAQVEDKGMRLANEAVFW